MQRHRPLSLPGLRSLYVRVLLTLVPLIPLVVLVNRNVPRVPGVRLPYWRILAELYFFPVVWIEGLGMHFELPLPTHPEIGIALRIAWALFLSVMLFRMLTRLAFRG